MQKQTVRDLPIRGKRVLVRADFNIPLDEKGRITDDTRIVKSLETLRFCLDQQAKLILMSHLGRPAGRPQPEFSLKPVAARLTELLGKKVTLLPNGPDSAAKARAEAMQTGEIVLLENLRFHPGEEKNDPEFSKHLASLGDVFVNDAFGSAHRAHASTVGVTRYLPSVAGFLLAREMEFFDKAMMNPERPFVTLLGGAKVSDKIKLIDHLLEKADTLLIGGAMAYTFYKVLGMGIGNSKFEPAGEPAAREALEKSKARKKPLVLPTDRVIAQKLESGAPTEIVEGDIPDGWAGFDIGPKTTTAYREILSKARTIVWNGPVGVFEVPPFDRGTRELANHLAGLQATTIIGGGDTAAAIKRFGLEKKMSHVSTGGGASLEYLEGSPLPGIQALRNRS